MKKKMQLIAVFSLQSAENIRKARALFENEILIKDAEKLLF